MTSQNLRNFIQQIYPNPNAAIFPRSKGMPERHYSKLLLVGHSQGAVVVRHAVISAVHERATMAATAGSGSPAIGEYTADWLLSAQIRLFAPALAGGSPSGLLGFFLQFQLTSAVVQPYLASLPGYNDMQPSNLLFQQLRSDTTSAARTNIHIRALRARVLYGESDNVVHPGAYPDDFIEPTEPDRGHTDICKPTERYMRPLSFVRYDDSGTS